MTLAQTSRLASIAGLLALGGPALADLGTFTPTLVPPVTGGTSTIGRGVNNNGWIVGQADSPSGLAVAFVYRNGASEELPLLTGGSDGVANSVNSAGVIVGSCRDAGGVQRPVRWDLVGGQWLITDLGTLEATNQGFGVATRVNESGQIAGYATVSVPGPYRGFIMTGAIKVDVGTLSYSGNLAYSQALGLNENGHVSGFAYRVLGGPEHGLLYTGGRGQDITPPEQFGLAQWHNVNSSGVLGGYVSFSETQGAFRPATSDGRSFNLVPLINGMTDGYGYDINDDGVFVGTMFLPQPGQSIFRAFAHQNGVTVDLSEAVAGIPGPITEATDVSGTGLIVGTLDVAGAPQAVLLTPGAPACAGDFNGSGGQPTVQDIFDFLAAYFNGDLRADMNRSGTVTVQDIFDFLSAYFAGC
ncbi:MAG: hypothetical protein IT438_03275 [Phycisphaerales bacterium]|nr:hypothetical protein [Phycisphaerales bacterium]